MGIYGHALDNSIVREGYIFDSKNIEYQVDEFKQGKVKTLFVTGMSGSGKSTLAHKLEKELGINCYELDDIGTNYNFSDDNLKEYGQEIYDWFNGPGKDFRIQPSEKGKKHNWSYIYACSEFIKYILSKNARCIVEGIHIFLCLDNKLLKIEQFEHSAMIIMGTSAIKSTVRALSRDYKNDKKEDPNLKLKDAIPFKYLVSRIKEALQDEKTLKKLREKYKKKESQ